MKIFVLLVSVSAITASAASLDVSQKNSRFSTDQQTSPQVIQPSKSKAKRGTASRWRGVKVQKINPAAQSSGTVEVSGFVFSKPADAPIPARPKVSGTPEKK